MVILIPHLIEEKTKKQLKDKNILVGPVGLEPTTNTL